MKTHSFIICLILATVNSACSVIQKCPEGQKFVKATSPDSELDLSFNPLVLEGSLVLKNQGNYAEGCISEEECTGKFSITPNGYFCEMASVLDKQYTYSSFINDKAYFSLIEKAEHCQKSEDITECQDYFLEKSRAVMLCKEYLSEQSGDQSKNAVCEQLEEYRIAYPLCNEQCRAADGEPVYIKANSETQELRMSGLRIRLGNTVTEHFDFSQFRINPPNHNDSTTVQIYSDRTLRALRYADFLQWECDRGNEYICSEISQIRNSIEFYFDLSDRN